MLQIICQYINSEIVSVSLFEDLSYLILSSIDKNNDFSNQCNLPKQTIPNIVIAPDSEAAPSVVTPLISSQPEVTLAVHDKISGSRSNQPIFFDLIHLS